MFERLDHTDKKRAVAYRHDDVRRNTSELLKRFIDVRLHAFVEEGVVDMVGVIGSFIAHFGTADIGAMVASARNHIDFGTVRFNHADFRGTRSFGNENFAFDARSRRISCDSIARVAA